MSHEEENDASATIEKSVQRRIFKIIVIGDSNVGKTCLTFRFCGGKFPDKTEATIGVDFREKTVDVEGETVKVREMTAGWLVDRLVTTLVTAVRLTKVSLNWSSNDLHFFLPLYELIWLMECVLFKCVAGGLTLMISYVRGLIYIID